MGSINLQSDLLGKSTINMEGPKRQRFSGSGAKTPSMKFNTDFREAYVQTRHKNLRCFPICSTVHMDKSFCGRIMEVSVSFPEDCEYTDSSTRDAYMVGEFRCTSEPLSFREGEKYERTSARHIRFIEGELVISSPSTDLRFIINPNRKWYYPRTTSDGEMHTYTVYLFMGEECISHLDTPEFKVLPIWKEERRASTVSSATDTAAASESSLKIKIANFKATGETSLPNPNKVPYTIMENAFPPPPPPRVAAVPPYLGNVIIATQPPRVPPQAILATVPPVIGPPNGSMIPLSHLSWQAAMPPMLNSQHLYPGQMGFHPVDIQHHQQHHLMAQSSYNIPSFNPVSSISLQQPYIVGPNQSPSTTTMPPSQSVLPQSPSSLPHFAPPQIGPNSKLLGQQWHHPMPYPQAHHQHLVKYQLNQMHQQRQNSNWQPNSETDNE